MGRRQTNAGNVPFETKAEFEFDECPANADAEGAHLLAGRRSMAAKVRLGFYVHLYASCAASKFGDKLPSRGASFLFWAAYQQEKIIVNESLT